MGNLSYYLEMMCNEGVIFSTKHGREKVLNTAKTLEENVKMNLNMIKQSIPLLEEWYNIINQSKTKPSDELLPKAQKVRDKCIKLDFDRGNDRELTNDSKQYISMHFQKLLNRADLKNSDISINISEFCKKCSESGIYYEECEKYINEIENLTEKLAKLLYSFDEYKDALHREIILTANDDYNFFKKQAAFTLRDIKIIYKNYKDI